MTEPGNGPPEGPPLEEVVYDSFDPSSVQQLRASEPVPDPSEEPVPDGPARVAEFDPRCREDFQGLLYLGALTARFSWLGHRFVVRTLRTGETLEATRLAADYLNTDGYSKALQSAFVAAAVVSVDGRPIAGVPMTSQPGDTAMAMAFRYVLDNWFPPTLDKVYEQYVLLEAKQREVLEAMGNPVG
jgi:hypothetical protein